MTGLIEAITYLLKWIFKVIFILGLIFITIMAVSKDFPVYFVLVFWFLVIVFGIVWGNIHED